MTYSGLAGPLRMIDLCWRNVGVLWDCLSWGIAGWAVDLAFGRQTPLGWPTRSLTAYLVVVMVWQAALGNAIGRPPHPDGTDRRGLVGRSVIARASGGVIGLLLLQYLTDSAVLVAEAVVIAAVAALVGAAGLAVLPCLRRRLTGRRPLTSHGVVIYGARRLGRECLTSIRSQADGEAAELVFVDDDPALRWLEVSGCPVLGAGADLERLAEGLGAREVVIAFANPDPGKVADLRRRLRVSGAQVSIFRSASSHRLAPSPSTPTLARAN